MSTQDKFNNILQSKFTNWKHSDNEAGWNEMRSKLKNTRKIKTRIKWAAAGSAVVLLSGIGMYASLNGHTGKNESTSISTEINTPVKTTSEVNNKNVVVSSPVEKPVSVNENKTANKDNSSGIVVVKNNSKENDNRIIHSGKTNEIVSHAGNDKNSNSTAGNSSNKIPPVNPKTEVNQPAVITSLTVNISGPASTCSASPVTLCGKVSGGDGQETYTWQPGNITGQCITVSPISTTLYTLSVRDEENIVTATKSIVVNASPKVSFSSDMKGGCLPASIQFNDLTTLASGKVVSSIWNFGNGDTSSQENPVYIYHTAGNYTVSLTVTSDNGCSSTGEIQNMIAVYSHPVASFALSPQSTTSAGTVVQFKDESTDAYGINNWSWSFNDGTDNSTSNLQNPSHTYVDTGMYYTHLVVTNSYGCKDSSINRLAIAPIFNLYIPTAFSPNGDGKNDVFQPVGQYVKSFEMYIYNRWGMQVYHTLDINKGWNGTTNGSSTVCPEDTYIYSISVVDSQNKNHAYTGMVNLIK